MSRRNACLILMAGLLCVSFFQTAWGDELRGTVRSVGFSSIQVIEAGHWDQEEIRVNADTVYDGGIGGIKDLAAGNEVTVSYKTVNSRKIAESVTRAAPEAVEQERLFTRPAATSEPTPEPTSAPAPEQL